MKRRRSSRVPRESLTPTARALWRAIFDEPMPRGWTVRWVGFMRGASGLTCYGSRRVLLSWSDLASMRPTWDRRANAPDRPACVVDVLTHEFIHMRHGKRLRHGADFERLHAAALRRLWARAA